ncbi:hypothetical protein KEM55_003979 [Ascosphaera atra]|nr:hypothetical protein KEM55_003979 [Ascosphaera atra]
MVWPFSSSSSTPDNAEKPKAADGGVIAPNRSSRQQCWIARDNFFGCLDKHDIVDSIRHDKEARSSCGKEMAEFEGACAKAWVSGYPGGNEGECDIGIGLRVKYFKEKRVMEYNRDKTIEKIKREEEAMNAAVEKQAAKER